MKKTNTTPKYKLDDQGSLTIENYNYSKPFSNFFPGIAGLWGIPMWVFYVNRGQCISSCGIESKDKSIMEFQPANKSYRLTSLQGFRTFIKISEGKAKEIYWEPFQEFLTGTGFKKDVKLSMTAHDLTLEEKNLDLGLTITVNYFTLPEEPYAALVRRVTIKNTGRKSRNIELVDGLPAIISYGLNDWVNKHISRTVEAWVKVCNVEKKAPYYQLRVEVSDKPQVVPIKEGNFYFSFEPQTKGAKLLDPIVEAAVVFGSMDDFKAPQRFLNGTMKVSKQQYTSNKTPSALSYTKFSLKAGQEKQIVSLLGYANSCEQLNQMVSQVTKAGFIERKASRNEEIINEIKNYALTRSSSQAFDQYVGNTFLDNILRGGLPVSLPTKEGNTAFNVYSRKHGDLERDYNFFTLAATYYTQGNGNFRDVNQNRRNDTWFNADVKDNHIHTFFNLIQADGYNPLVIRGTTFVVKDFVALEGVLRNTLDVSSQDQLKSFLKDPFLPGALLKFIEQHQLKLNVELKDFLGQILGISQRHELADHGEGFWSDHWTYNLDLIESYLAIYPEELEKLLFQKKDFSFYFNSHYVYPRDHRYILTDNGVRQYHSVKDDPEHTKAKERGHKLRVKHGEGDVYQTHLTCKILCLLANKVATLDPSGIGIEMEAEKPNWYDALNGLPGLLGSSISETIEVKRLSEFLLNSLKGLVVNDEETLPIFEELANFIRKLIPILSSSDDALSYWNKSNDVKEVYRSLIHKGIDGKEKFLTIAEIKNFLQLVIQKVDKSIELAQQDVKQLVTYFYHEVTEYKDLGKAAKHGAKLVLPLQFKRHNLPPFLEGYVHALRVASKDQAKKLYEQIRKGPLFDKKLKMYKVNADLSKETEEIGRTTVFPAGWLENESVWLHMEYKFMLELLRGGLYEEFYENFKNVLIPFLKPEQYGRSILENSSFIVSSAHKEEKLHGQGFVARLSGSTAELLHIWLYMNLGANPFSLNEQKQLTLTFNPILPGWIFSKDKKEDLPKNTYAFNFLHSTLVVYHNPKRLNTFGGKCVEAEHIVLTYPKSKEPIIIRSAQIIGKYAQDIRDRKVERIDVYFE